MPGSDWSLMLDLTTLEKALAAIFAHLRAEGVQSVSLTDDYYWDLDQPADRYNVLKEPEKPTIGQLSHDWERIQQIAADDHFAVGYGLVWAAALLRAVGERNAG